MTKIRREEDGAVAVEFVVVMILLFTILFGVIEFGITLNKYQMYVGAAREGARYDAVRCQPDGSCTNALIQQRTLNSVGCTAPCAVGDYFFPGTPASSISTDGGGTWTANKFCDSTTAGNEVKVSWEQHFSIQVPFVPDLSFNKTVEGVFRCE